MEKRIIQKKPAKALKKHTQTLLGEMVPVVNSLTEELTKPKVGQPTIRTDDVISEIAVRLACGHSLLMICNNDHMPAYRTVMEWQQKDPELKLLFNECRKEGAYALDDVAELIARKHPLVASLDFRYDDLLVSVLAQKKRYANRERFGDKATIDIVHHEPVVLDGTIIYGDGGDGV